MKNLFPLILLMAMACSQSAQEDQSLPIMGNKIYEANDTIYHTIQDFRLVDQDSSIVTNDTFADKIYVADFFFTSCPTICPKMKAQMLRVYDVYKETKEVAIVSHTIDPDYDTVALLKDYSERLGVSSDTWKFVTGDKDEIYDLAEQSYMSIADEDANAPGGYIHSGAFLLVDKSRRIRGAYDGTEPDQVDVLIKDIERLLETYKTEPK